MSDFVSQLRLAEKAAEDIYFAKLSRELIASLHERMQAEENSLQASGQSSTKAWMEGRPVVMKETSGS